MTSQGATRAPSHGPVLVMQGVTVRHGSTLALDDVDLEVADGEIVSVLGPSGSGKTTLLRAVAGLEPLTAGRVHRDGVDVTDVAPHRRELGMMFQDHTLFPHRDVLGNVAFGLRMRGLPRAEVAARAEEALRLVGLAGFGDRSVRELSGGEAQRVALARALAPEPRLLMLDEPFGGLDRALREHLVEELRDLFTRLGQAVLVVTHDHDEAFGLGDRVAILHSARLVQVGTPVEVWSRPADQRVARFLGWNVLTPPDGGPAVAVAPDSLRLAESDGTTGAGDGWRGTVASSAFRRDHFLVRVVLDEGPDAPPDRDGAPTVELVNRGQPPAPGTRVRLVAEAGTVLRLPEEACTGSPHLGKDFRTTAP